MKSNPFRAFQQQQQNSQADYQQANTRQNPLIGSGTPQLEPDVNPMKPKLTNSKSAWTARGSTRFTVACFVLGLASWGSLANGDEGSARDLSAGSDSVGTLPIVGSTDAPTENGLLAELWPDTQTAVTVTLPSSQALSLIQASGVGQVYWDELGDGQARLTFRGPVELAIPESSLIDGTVEIGMDSGSDHNWYYAVQVNRWQSLAYQVKAGEPLPMDIMRALPLAQSGTPVTVLSVTWPGQRMALEIYRGSGMVTFHQLVL